MHALFSALFLLLALFVPTLRAAEVIPPAPKNHFNDYAGAVSQATAQRLNAELDQFERQTSNQIVVVIYPKMESASSIEDFTTRTFQSWGVGGKAKSNGAALFVFVQDHTLRIQTGYGLEGALPDVLSKQIIENELVPRFRANDFDGGITNGVHAMLAATRGEYQGTGRTARDGKQNGSIWPFGIFVAFIVLMSLFRRSRGTTVYGRNGRRSVWINSGGGGGWGGGGGGGGSFSGGGGSTGGGGASGKW